MFGIHIIKREWSDENVFYSGTTKFPAKSFYCFMFCGSMEKKKKKNGCRSDSGDKRLKKDEGLDSLAECF